MVTWGLAFCWPELQLAATMLLFNRRLLPVNKLHLIWIAAGVASGFLIINNFTDRLGEMLSLAMIISFLTAPVFAWLNYRIMLSGKVPAKYQPGRNLRLLSIAGIIFQAGFGLVFLYWYFFLR